MTIQESIIRAAKHVNQLTASFGREYGLTPRQIDVILILAAEPGLTQVAITERSGIDRSTLAAVMRLLRAKGWVRSVRSKEDSRAQNNFLTAKGSGQIENARRIRERVDGALYDAVSGKADALCRTLARVVA
jgi:DNA-binding MarR family transcriptional regulator